MIDKIINMPSGGPPGPPGPQSKNVCSYNNSCLEWTGSSVTLKSDSNCNTPLNYCNSCGTLNKSSDKNLPDFNSKSWDSVNWGGQSSKEIWLKNIENNIPNASHVYCP